VWLENQLHLREEILDDRKAWFIDFGIVNAEGGWIMAV
jgi:hypothetical protein